MSASTVNSDDIGDIDFSVDLTSPDAQALAAGFNEYGVKDTDDRVEFVFEAMQPGMRNGVKITEEFLKTVADNFENEQPAQVDHDRSMFANAGRVTDMWFSDGALRLQGYVPKTGAQTHQEFVNRFNFDPPQVQNGSVGFGMAYELSEDEQGNPMLVDGEMQEFSFLPFPGGYDEETGGLKAQFEEARKQYAEQNMSEVYEMWDSLTNMTEEEMDMWEDHPCSDKGVDDGEDMRDNFYMLSGQPMEGWGQEEMAIANAAIDFMVTETEKDPDDPESGGPGSCPSRWTVNLLNRGHNPLDDFPSGNPQFADQGDDHPDDDTSQDSVSGVESFDATLDTKTLHNFNTMSFERIDFDELGDDVSDEVAEFLSQVEEQHKQNVEFIETVTDDRDSVESELQEYKQELATELADREAVLFEADELVDFDMSRLHQLDADSQEFEGSETKDEESGDGEGDANFGSKERKSQDFTGDSVDDRAKDGLDGMSGIALGE